MCRSISAMTLQRSMLGLATVMLCLVSEASAARRLSQAQIEAARIPTMNLPVTDSGPAAGGASTAAAGTSAAASATAVYPTFEAALEAANSPAANMSMLLEGIKVAGVTSALNSSTTWTILAPTNRAFQKRLAKDLNITPEDFLKNKTLVLQVLLYHVIPSAAIKSAKFVEGQKLITALPGAAPLTVRLDRTTKDGSPRPTPQLKIEGETDTAEVKVPDILVGSSVVHVVNDVLLPLSACPICR